MPADVDPIVGNWYRSREKLQRFEVVAVDEEDGGIEIQHFDGDIEEIDRDTWLEMDLEPVEAPEDWTGPMDEVLREEITYATSDMEPREWDADLAEVQPPPSPRPEDGDDWDAGQPPRDPDAER